MFIGSLLDKQSPVGCSYAYFERGTAIRTCPDLISESFNKEFYTKTDGNLFLKKPIGFSDLTILNVGVDIVIYLDSSCFIDHVRLLQNAPSAISSVQIFSEAGCIGAFHAETGQVSNRSEIFIPIGQNAKTLTLRFDTQIHDLILEEIHICGALFDDDNLFPLPNFRQNRKGSFSIRDIKQIVTADVSDDICFAAELLSEKLCELHSVSLPVCSGKACENAIAFQYYEGADSLQNVSESFILDSMNGKIVLKASDRRGFLYAAEALLMLLQNECFPNVLIKDAPFCPFRGVHISTLPTREDLEFFKRFVKYMLLPLRYNTMVLEVCGTMRYESHPEITEAWLKAASLYRDGKLPAPPHGGCVLQGTLWEKDEVAEIVSYIKSFGIEVIPEVQSLGHVQYITYAHPEIGEVQLSAGGTNALELAEAGEVTNTFPASHSYCPSNPKSLEILLDLLDEIVDVFQPERYVHMGHDEVNNLGSCPLCRKKHPSDILAEHINKLYQHLAKHGLKMMIWSDMLQNHTNEMTPYLTTETESAGSKIPKDIVLCDFIWYFQTERDIEDHLLRQGFPVVIGNLYSSYYPRYNTRIRKEGMLGGLTAAWVATNEYIFARQGKMFDFAYIANMLWNNEYTNEHRRSYTYSISSLLQRFRQHIRKENEPACAKQLLAKDQLEPLTTALSSLHERGIQGFLSVPCGKEAIQPIDGYYSHLAFMHASEKNTKRIWWQSLVEQGEYEIIYEDQSRCRIPLEYGGNIGAINIGYAMPLPYPYHHQGYITTYFSDPLCCKNDRGEDVTIYRYIWKNPNPGLKIHEIRIVKNDTTDGNLLLFGINGELC